MLTECGETELIIHRYEAFDLDDTLLKREFITRLAGSLLGKYHDSIPNYSLYDIPRFLDHTPIDKPGFKRTALFWHRRRKAFSGIAQKLKDKSERDIKLIGISGRPSTIEWESMTKGQLAKENLLLDKLILTPIGTPSWLSKADIIKKYGIDEYSDDDGHTILNLSALFPHTAFNWVRHNIVNVSADWQVMLKSRKNVRTIQVEEWGQLAA